MKHWLSKFIKICPKTGKFRGFRDVKGLYKFLLPIFGLAALVWILIRVIPKPGRISYPCVKAAMPFAAGLLGNILFFILSAFAFLRLRKSFFRYQFIIIAIFITIGAGGAYYLNSPGEVQLPTNILEPNTPMGEAKGIFPGRVVWVHNPEATRENCNPLSTSDGWWLAKNNNQIVIDEMLSDGMQGITGTSSDAEAWNSVFIHFNKNKGKGEVGYKAGEKIFIKINATSSWSGNFETGDLSKVKNGNFSISETSPQMMMAVLKHLVSVVGVAQKDIYIGDPLKHIYKHIYDYLHPEFPEIHYLDVSGYTNLGREKVVASTKARIYYSDRGAQLRNGNFSNAYDGPAVTDDYLYTIFDETDYMINIPMLKGHKRAGVTMFAKNHFGSHTRGSAVHLHCGLPAPNEMQNGITEPGYGRYRIQVDLLGHEFLGGKNLIYILDALWAADHELGTPKKFKMLPFNDDWMSSLFISLDPVAIESVGYDFLRSEFTEDRDNSDGSGTYVQMDGVDDYLHQSADSLNWPEGIKYDPEKDGTTLKSLGTHEHWNSALDMKYSRNLGTGSGIELFKVDKSVGIDDREYYAAKDFKLYQNYPNPFNPSTVISYSISENSYVKLSVYDALGKEITELMNKYQSAGYHHVSFNAASSNRHLVSGIYYYKLQSRSLETGKIFVQTSKMILLK